MLRPSIHTARMHIIVKSAPNHRSALHITRRPGRPTPLDPASSLAHTRPWMLRCQCFCQMWGCRGQPVGPCAVSLRGSCPKTHPAAALGCPSAPPPVCQAQHGDAQAFSNSSSHWTPAIIELTTITRRTPAAPQMTAHRGSLMLVQQAVLHQCLGKGPGGLAVLWARQHQVQALSPATPEDQGPEVAVCSSEVGGHGKGYQCMTGTACCSRHHQQAQRALCQWIKLDVAVLTCGRRCL